MFLNLENLDVRYRPFPIGVARPVMAEDLYRRCVEAFPPLELFDDYDKILRPGRKYTLSEKENPKALQKFVSSNALPDYASFSACPGVVQSKNI